MISFLSSCGSAMMTSEASSPIFLSILSFPVHKCQFFVPQSQTAKQRMHVGYIAQINTHIRNSQRFQKFQRHDNDFAVTFRRRIPQHFHPALCEVLPMRGFSEKFAENRRHISELQQLMRIRVFPGHSSNQWNRYIRTHNQYLPIRIYSLYHFPL